MYPADMGPVSRAPVETNDHPPSVTPASDRKPAASDNPPKIPADQVNSAQLQLQQALIAAEQETARRLAEAQAATKAVKKDLADKYPNGMSDAQWKHYLENDPVGKKFNEQWGGVQRSAANQLRLAADGAGNDPKAAAAAVDKEAKALKKTGKDDATLNLIVDDAAKQVKGETPEARKTSEKAFRVEIVDRTPGSSDAAKTQAFKEFKGALNHELALAAAKLHLENAQKSKAALDKLPGGARNADMGDVLTELSRAREQYDKVLKGDDDAGVDVTPEEQQQAAQSIIKRHDGEVYSQGDKQDPLSVAGQTVVVSTEQTLQHNLATIDVNDPTLSSAEKQLAQDDPVAFAMLKMTGIHVDPAQISNPKEKALAQKDPLQYALYKMTGVDVTRLDPADPKLSAADRTALKNGNYMLPAIERADPSIVMKMGLLMNAGKDVRTDYVEKLIQPLLQGGRSDKKDEQILAILAKNMSQARLPGEASDLWNQVGAPRFSDSYLQSRLNGILGKDGAAGSDDPAIAQAKNKTLNADRAGIWMQQMTRNAPPQLAAQLVNLVTNRFDGQWLGLNEKGTDFTRDIGAEFYNGLNQAVQVADQLDPDGHRYASQAATWLLDNRSLKEGGSHPDRLFGFVMDLGSVQPFDKIRQSTADGYGTDLGHALSTQIAQNPNSPCRTKIVHGTSFDKVFQQGVKEYNDRNQRLQFSQYAQQTYDGFKANPNKGQILQKYFDGFAHDYSNQPVSFSDETQLRNFIAAGLNMQPDDIAMPTAVVGGQGDQPQSPLMVAAWLRQSGYAAPQQDGKPVNDDTWAQMIIDGHYALPLDANGRLLNAQQLAQQIAAGKYKDVPPPTDDQGKPRDARDIQAGLGKGTFDIPKPAPTDYGKQPIVDGRHAVPVDIYGTPVSAPALLQQIAAGKYQGIDLYAHRDIKKIVDPIAKEIHDKAGKAPQVDLVPLYYVSSDSGAGPSALFHVKDGNKDQWIDDRGWSYGSLHDYLHHNALSEGGTVYLPTDMKLGDRDHDGHIDYTHEKAHQVSGWERTEHYLDIGVGLVTGAAGVALMATGVGSPVGLTLLGVSAVGMGWGIYRGVEDLDNLSSHGQSINPFANGQAAQDYFGILMSAGGIAASGALFKGATLLRDARSLAGVEGTVNGTAVQAKLDAALRWDRIGMNINRPLMAGGAYTMVQQGGTLLTHWGDMDDMDRWGELGMLGLNVVPFGMGKFAKTLQRDVADTRQQLLNKQQQATQTAEVDPALWTSRDMPADLNQGVPELAGINSANANNLVNLANAGAAAHPGSAAPAGAPQSGAQHNGNGQHGNPDQPAIAPEALLYRGRDAQALYDAAATGQLQDAQQVYLIFSVNPSPTMDHGVVLGTGRVRQGKIEWDDGPAVPLDDHTHFVVTPHDAATVSSLMGQNKPGIGPYAVHDGANGWIMPDELAATHAADGNLKTYFPWNHDAQPIDWSPAWRPETMVTPPEEQSLLYRAGDVHALYQDAAARRLAPGAHVSLISKVDPTADMSHAVLLATGKVDPSGQLQWDAGNPDVTLAEDCYFVVSRHALTGDAPAGPYAVHHNGRWIPNERIVDAIRQGNVHEYFPPSSFEPQAAPVHWTSSWTPWGSDPAMAAAPPAGQTRVYRGGNMRAVGDAAWHGEVPEGQYVHIVSSRMPGPNFESGTLAGSGQVDAYGKIVWDADTFAGHGNNGNPPNSQKPPTLTLTGDHYIVVNDLTPQAMRAQLASGGGLGAYALYDGPNGWIPHESLSASNLVAPLGDTGTAGARQRPWRPFAPEGEAQFYRTQEDLYRAANTRALPPGKATPPAVADDGHADKPVWYRRVPGLRTSNTRPAAGRGNQVPAAAATTSSDSYVYLVRHDNPGQNLKGGEVLGWGQVNQKGGISWDSQSGAVTLGDDTHFVVTDLAPDAMQARLTKTGLRFAVQDDDAGWIPHKQVAAAVRKGDTSGIFPSRAAAPSAEPAVWRPDGAAMRSGTSLPTVVRTGQQGAAVDAPPFWPNPAGPRQLRGWERVADTLGERLFMRRKPAYDAAWYETKYNELKKQLDPAEFAGLKLPAPGSFGVDDMTRVLAAIPGGLEHVIADVHAHSMGYDRRSGNLFAVLLDRSGKYERILFGSIPQFCGGDGHYSTVNPSPATMKHAAALDDRVAQDFLAEYSKSPRRAAQADLSITGLEFSNTSKQDPVARAKALMQQYPGLFKFSGELTANKEMITVQLGPDAWDVDTQRFRNYLKFASESGLGVLLHNDWGIHGLDEAGRPEAVKQYYENFDKMISVLSNPQYRNLNIVFAHTGIGRFVRPDDAMSTGYVTVVKPDGTKVHKLITAPEHIHRLYKLFEHVPNARADISWNDVTQAYVDSPRLRTALIDFIVDNQDRLLFGSDTVKPVNTGQYNQALNTGAPLFAAIAQRDPVALWKLLRGNYETLMADSETRVAAWTRANRPDDVSYADWQRRMDEMDQMHGVLNAHRGSLLAGAWQDYHDWLAALDSVQQSAQASPDGDIQAIVVAGGHVPAGHPAAAAATASNPGVFPSQYDALPTPQDQRPWRIPVMQRGSQNASGTTGGHNNASVPRKVATGAIATGTTVAAGSAEAFGLSHPASAAPLSADVSNAAAFDVRGLMIGAKTLYGEKVRLDWEAMFEEGHVTRAGLDRFVGRLVSLAPHLGMTDRQMLQLGAVTEQFWENYQFLRDLPTDSARGWTAQQKFHAIMAKVGEYQITVDRIIDTQASSINALDARAPAGKLYRLGTLGTYLFNDAATAAWLMNGQPHGLVDTAFHVVFGAANGAMTLHTIGALSGGFTKTTWESGRLAKWAQGGSMATLGAGGLAWMVNDGFFSRAATAGPISAGLDGAFTLGAVWAARNELNKSLARPMDKPAALARPYYLMATALVARELLQLGGGGGGNTLLALDQRRQAGANAPATLFDLQARTQAGEPDALADSDYIVVPVDDIQLGDGSSIDSRAAGPVVAMANNRMTGLARFPRVETPEYHTVARGESLWRIVRGNLPELLTPAQKLRASFVSEDEQVSQALAQFYQLNPVFDPSGGEGIDVHTSPVQNPHRIDAGQQVRVA